MDMGEAFAAKSCARGMQHRSHSAFRAGTQGNGGIRVVPKPAAQSIPPFLLDLDGTLVDSVYEHVMAWREALEERSESRAPRSPERSALHDMSRCRNRALNRAD